MAKLITIYWRDIPSQVIARKGRESIKVPLSPRFREAIDRAAMRAGKGSSEQYLEDWRRVSGTCSGIPEEAARAEAERIESAFDDELLEKMVKAGGRPSPNESDGG